MSYDERVVLTLDPFADSSQPEQAALFDGPGGVMLPHELGRRPVPERTVRPVVVVVDPPSFDLRPRVLDRRELVHVQALVPQPTIERLDECVFRRFPGRVKSNCTPRRYAQSSSARD